MKQVNVLIVEDDVVLSEEVAEMLREQGFCVEFARTLVQVQRRLNERTFDLFVVDLVLPDGHGHEVIRNIRKVSSAGIVVLSGKLDEVDKVVSLELGADDYVIKPFARSEFVARVRSLLRRLEANNAQYAALETEEAEIVYGAFRTDTKARKLYAPSGEIIRLTKLEFDLWMTFLKNLDRVLSREQIILSVRGRDWAGYDRSIDGLVCRLRKKLSGYPDMDVDFETLRGVGYLLRSVST